MQHIAVRKCEIFSTAPWHFRAPDEDPLWISSGKLPQRRVRRPYLSGAGRVSDGSSRAHPTTVRHLAAQSRSVLVVVMLSPGSLMLGMLLGPVRLVLGMVLSLIGPVLGVLLILEGFMLGVLMLLPILP